jgi:hypothetical protein
MPLSLFRDLVLQSENQMATLLAEARAKFEHKGDRGSAGAEAPFRDFLTKFLARDLRVGQGEVIDTAGNRSGQTDVVVADADHPFLFTADVPGLFLIEGISAAGEIKTVLSSAALEKALESAARFKELRPRQLAGSLITAEDSDIERFYDGRPFFLVAFESQMTTDTVVRKVKDFEAQHSGPTFDGIFLLERGWAINVGDGLGAFQPEQPGHEPATGWVVEEVDEVLFDFLVWLSAVIPRIVRFRPIMQLYL